MGSLEQINKIKKAIEDSNKLFVFEFQVFDKRTKQNDYIIFDIDFDDVNLNAQSVSLTHEQRQNKLCSCVTYPFDFDNSIDDNLSELYDNCINAILCSDFYDLV